MQKTGLRSFLTAPAALTAMMSVLIAGCQSPLSEAGDAVRQSSDHRIKIASAYRDGECQAMFRLMGREAHPDYYPVQRAIMMIEGKCAARDPAAAAEILKRYEEPDRYNHVATARLGDLLAKGHGVERDETRARAIFRRAALSMADELYPMVGSSIFEFQIREAAVWDSSATGMVLGFAEPLTGPWDIPEALQNEADLVLAFEEKGAEGLIELAVQVRFGTGEYEADPEMAFSWLGRAAGDFEHLPAKKLFVKWAYDKEFCRLERTECDDSRVSANFYLKDIAAADDLWALKAVSECITLVADYPEKKLADYFWLLERKRRGWSYDPAALKAAKNRLSETDQGLMEDWKSVDSSRVPFTLLGETVCPVS